MFSYKGLRPGLEETGSQNAAQSFLWEMSQFEDVLSQITDTNLERITAQLQIWKHIGVVSNALLLLRVHTKILILACYNCYRVCVYARTLAGFRPNGESVRVLHHLLHEQCWSGKQDDNDTKIDASQHYYKTTDIEMPIRSLESFLFENKLVSTSSIETLKNATIGIDVEHYLSRIYTSKKEALLYAIGGVPSSLKQYVQSDLKVFTASNIRPLFILPGLKIANARRNHQMNGISAQEQHLDATWAKIHLKQANLSANVFSYTGDSFRFGADPLPIQSMMNDLISIFIEFDVDYMVSPYDASFQLSYLYQNKVVDCIYGSTDLLLTEIDNFILGMEFQSKEFRYVNKQKVLRDLNLSERQFLDICVIIGCAAQPETFSVFPPIPNLPPFSQLNFFRTALDLLLQLSSTSGPQNNLFGYINSLKDESLLDLYYSGLAAIKFMPIMSLDGHVRLFLDALAKQGRSNEDHLFMKEEEIPSNQYDKAIKEDTICIPGELHDVISQRLPSEIYFYQSLGLIPVRLLEAIVSGKLYLRPPLAMGEGDSYKKLITSRQFQTVLDFQFNLITQLLARYYQVKKIEVSYWFRKDSLHLNNRMEITFPDRPIVAEYISSSVEEMPSVWSLFGGSSKTSDAPSDKCDTLAIAFRRALFMLQVSKGESESKGIYRVMEIFCESNPDVKDEELESLFLILLYYRSTDTPLVHIDKNFGAAFSNLRTDYPEISLTPEETSRIFIISIIFSTQKFNISPINYQGPVSRSLLAFRSHLKIFHEMAQNSLLVCFLDLVVKDEKFKAQNTARREWYRFINKIPFYKDMSNTLLGVVSQLYFGTCLKLSKLGDLTDQCVEAGRNYLLNTVFQVGKESHNINLDSVNSVSLEQFQSDFDAGVRFWDHFENIARIARCVDETLISDAGFNLIEEADKIVKQFSPH